MKDYLNVTPNSLSVVKKGYVITYFRKKSAVKRIKQ